MTGCPECDDHAVPETATIQSAQIIHRELHNVGRELWAAMLRPAEATVRWLTPRLPRGAGR